MNNADYVNLMSKLDKIIELLELRNSIEVARGRMRSGTIYFDDSEIFPKPETSAIDPSMLCNCGNHKSGEGTGGWFCPVHGQRF